MPRNRENKNLGPLRRVEAVPEQAATSNLTVPDPSGVRTAEPKPSSSSPLAALLRRTLAWLVRPQVILFLLVVLVGSRDITQGEFHFYTDETRHAMSGVFFRDLLLDFPVRHPIQYAYEYYAKYPAIAVPHWPPLFYVVEALFFLAFGLSVWASRLAVLSFGLLGAYFWYHIAERQGPRSRAFLSTAIFVCMPYVLLYERVTMLEIPGLALCLAAIHFWLRWMETERPRELWLLAGAVAAAFLTSQVAIFLVFLLGLHFLLERRFRLLRRPDVWLAMGAVLLIVVPWYLLSIKTLTVFSERAVAPGLRHFGNQNVWLYYLKNLPLQMGWVLLSLGAAGMGLALFTALRRYRFLLLWIVSCYLCFLIVPEEDTRHTMIWIPPLVYFALLAVEVLCVRPQWGRFAAAALALFFFVNALRREPPRVKGIEEIAQFVLAQPDSDLVYYQGGLNGDFIFFVRKYDPEKRHMVARDKQVVVTQMGYAERQILHTPEEILNLFRDWGIRYAVVEGRDHEGGLEPAYQAFNSAQFQVLRTFRLSSNDPDLDNELITVYHYRGEFRRKTRVTIPMMTIRGDIHADLTRLVGRPWPN